ncbi:MAG: 3-deoxy-7-phosphoheptulonate synthase [Actinobacteria bacterium]|nr:3-deoxy-7-phosphoheptulonate synthase [Actinomycetota bacterium]
MIIVLKPQVTDEQINQVVEKIKSQGLDVHISKGKFRTIIGVIGEEEAIRSLPLEAWPEVEKVMPVLKPYKLVSLEFRTEPTVVDVRGVKIGGGNFTVMAGPCSVETREQLFMTAEAVKNAGAKILRGGAFKPRTSPYSFQGLGIEGLKLLKEVSEITGLPVVTEVMDVRQIEDVKEHADILQIGARNMQNFNLLSEVGKTGKPVLLKRGFSNTVEELLMAAEYIAREGNDQILLCERGIRTFEVSTRNTLDISAIPVLKRLTHLPVVVDPSHAAGRSDIVPELCLAAIAAGADGLIVEVHPDPKNALCDGPQSLDLKQFQMMMEELRQVAQALGRKL